VTTTWLDGLPAGDTDWDRFASAWPTPFGALAEVVKQAWDATDPVLLELCRLRMATLLAAPAELARRTGRARAAGLTEAKIAELPSWPTSPTFSASERACLALTEQFVIDANGVSDEQVAEVTSHLGPEGTYRFVQALSAVETFQRACLTLGIETMPDVDRLTAPVPVDSESIDAQEVRR
jgi:alkylhydroperoxidase family enzyme